MAKRIGVKRLVLTHLRAAMDQVQHWAGIEGELRQHFGDGAIIGEDLMTSTLDG